MNCGKVKAHIIKWLEKILKDSGQKGFVIGVSGGVDSAVVSTLCAETGHPFLCISMPIHQSQEHLERAHLHMKGLKKTYNHYEGMEIDLTQTFDYMKTDLGDVSELALANTRSRLRMTTLYAWANTKNYLVAGTGNKIEDMGVMFFTKGGDGLVDLSPIGDLKKTQIWKLAKYLTIDDSIIQAKPADGLWYDNRSDEEAIGASYPDLERIMDYCESLYINSRQDYQNLIDLEMIIPLKEPDEKILMVYLLRHEAGGHKMKMPPICHINCHGNMSGRC